MRRRTLGKLIIGVGAAMVMIAGLVLAILLLVARHELIAGANEARTAQAQLASLSPQETVASSLVPARDQLDHAQSDVRNARLILDPLAPLLTHLGWVPSAGDELAAAPSVAKTADLALTGATDLVSTLSSLTPHSGSVPSLPSLLRRLVKARRAIASSCQELHDAHSSQRTIPAILDAPLRTELRILDRNLPRLLGLCRTLRVLPDILGYRRARVYLVAYQDSEELRATGGFIGSESVLTIQAGTIHQLFGGSSFLGAGSHPFGAHDVLTIPPPEPIGLYNREPEWLFRDSNWSPDFPTSAQLEAYIFKADSGIGVDGVINLTPQSSAEILTAVGPVYVPAFHVTATPANVVRLTDRLVHPAPTTAASIDVGADPDTQRKRFIGALTNGILARLRRPTLAMLLRLGQALTTGFARGDILVYLRNRSAERIARMAGASGELLPTPGDYLYVVDSNLSYNKINPWIHLSTLYQVRIRPDRWLDARLTIHLGDYPPSGVDVAGVGPCYGACGSKDEYAGYLRVLTPTGAQLVDQHGWTQPWSPGTAYGKTEFAGYLIVPRDRTRTVTLHYIIPPNVFILSKGRAYTLLVQHQPGSHPDRIQVEVSWETGSRAYTVAHPVATRAFSVAIPRRAFQPIPLPRAPETEVLPGHWIEPHAFLTGP